MNILMLNIEASRGVGTTNDHLEAFEKYSNNNVLILDARTDVAREIDYSLFDCFVIHHSVPIGYDNILNDDVLNKIQSFDGLKVLFIQDEMRWVDKTAKKIKDLGISVVFSVVNSSVTRKIYRDAWFDDVRFENVLTGYVPENLLSIKTPDYAKRPIDVSYRARKLLAWCGSFGQEKFTIADRFLKDAREWNLRCDISCKEKDRIYGKSWIKFVSNSKAVLGAESGASFIDFSGLIAPAVDEYEARNPNKTFEEVRDKFLEGRDGEIKISVISPRCFEAAALRTLMIMYDGEYSGVLVPGKHFLVLNRDHSNMNEVVNVIRTPNLAEEITSAAYDDICLSGLWSYKSLVEKFDAVVKDEVLKCGGNADRSIDARYLRQLVSDCKRQARNSVVKYKVAVFLSKLFSFLVQCATFYLPKKMAERIEQKVVSGIEPLKIFLKRFLLG